MAKVAAKQTRVWVDEHALSGYLSGADLKVDQETVKVDVFSSSGPERVVGNYDTMLSLAGFFDGADDAFDEIAFVNLRTDETHYAFSAFGGVTEGSRGYEQPIRLKSQPVSSKVGAAVLLNLEAEGDGPISRAHILRSAAVTGTGNGTGQNLGATTSGQLFVVTYRILAVSGTGSIVLQCQESQNDGSPDTYASISDLASGTLSGVGVTRKTTTAATEAYKRISVTTFSGFTSVTILVTAGLAAA